MEPDKCVVSVLLVFSVKKGNVHIDLQSDASGPLCFLEEARVITMVSENCHFLFNSKQVESG